MSIFTRERYHWIGVITVDPSLFCFHGAGTLRTGTALLDFFQQEAEAADFSVTRKQETRQLRASAMLARPLPLCTSSLVCSSVHDLGPLRASALYDHMRVQARS